MDIGELDRSQVFRSKFEFVRLSSLSWVDLSGQYTVCFADLKILWVILISLNLEILHSELKFGVGFPIFAWKRNEAKHMLFPELGIRSSVLPANCSFFAQK